MMNRRNVTKSIKSKIQSFCLSNKISQLLATIIENEVYEIFVRTHRLQYRYRWKIRQVIYNLEMNGNYLLSNYPCTIIPYLSSEQLAVGTIAAKTVERNRTKMEEVYRLLRNGLIYELSPEFGISSMALRCRNCQSTEIQWESRQLRSADEPATIFCECTKCGTRWRMG